MNSYLAITPATIEELQDFLSDLERMELEAAREAVQKETTELGKGDTPRKVDQERYSAAFETVFGDVRRHVCRKFVKPPNGNHRGCYYCGEPEVETF